MADSDTILLKVRLDPKTFGLSEEQIKKLAHQELVLKPPKGDGPGTPLGLLGGMRAELQKLKAAQEAAFDPKDVKAYTVQIRDLETKMKDLVGVEEKIESVSPFEGLLPQVTMIGAATAGIGAMAAMIGKGVKGMVELDEAVSFIGTLGVQNFEKFNSKALEISNRIGTESAANIANEIYNAISGGISEGGAAGFVELAAKAAVAGRATTAEAANLGTSLLNAYKMDAKDAGAMFDEVFQIVNLGKISVAEFNQAGANIIPIASAAGVPLKQWGAALATMTKQGVPATQASTRLAQAMIEVQKPGKDLEAVMKQAGITNGEYALRTLGLQGTLQKLQETAAKNGQSMTQVFSSSEAAAAALALTGQNAAGATADLEGMSNAAGATDKAFNIMNESLGVKLQSIATRFENFLISTMQKLEPVFVAALGAAEPLLDLIEKYGPVVAEFAGVILAMVAAWAAYKAAVEGAKIAQSAMATLLEKNPYGVAIAAAAALVLGIRELADALQETAEEKQADLVAEGEWLTKQKEGLVTQRDQVKATKELANNYITLAEKSKRTKEENDQLKKLGDDLNRQYPGLIDNTKSYGESLDSVRKYAQGAAGQIEDYNKKITKLDKDIAKNQVKQLENAVTEALEKMTQNVADQNRNILNKAAKSVLGFDTVEENVKDFAVSFRKALFSSKTEADVTKALADFNTKIGKARDAGEFNASVAVTFYGGAEKAAAARVDYLANRMKILTGEAEKANAALNGGDPPPPPPPPPKVIGYVETLTEKIAKLREQQSKLGEKGITGDAGTNIEKQVATLETEIQRVKDILAGSLLDESDMFDEDLPFMEEAIKQFDEQFGKSVDDIEKKSDKFKEKVEEIGEKIKAWGGEFEGVDVADLMGMSDSELDDLAKRMKLIEDLYFDLGKNIGENFAKMMGEGQPAMKAFYKSILVGALDFLKGYIILVALKTTLDELMTKGPLGFITAGLITGAVYGMLSIAQDAVTGFAKGGVIVGERGPEVIAPAKEFSEFAGQIVSAAMLELRRATEDLREGRAQSRAIEYRQNVRFELLNTEMEHDVIRQSYKIAEERAEYRKMGGLR